MNPCDIFRLKALYNKWANQILYPYLKENAAHLLEVKDASDPPDIIVILNENLWEDRLWMHRASGYGQAPHPVNKLIYPAFDKLTAAREEEDLWLKNFTHNLTAPTLDTVHRYRNQLGNTEQSQLYEILSHIFDQESTGRGKVIQILTETGLTPPDIKMSSYLSQQNSIS